MAAHNTQSARSRWSYGKIEDCEQSRSMLSYFFQRKKKRERKRSCPSVAIDQHAFGVSSSRWRQQRLSGRRRGWGRSVEIAVYGCIDTCSRKMLWVKVWVYLYKATTIASKLIGWIKDQKQEWWLYAVLSPTASWGHGSSGDSHVWAINVQSSMCTFLCDAVFC